jgi:general L-amino acid transport system permease protein
MVEAGRLKSSRAPEPGRAAFLNDPTVRAIFYQVLLLVIVGGAGWYLVHNTLTNMQRQGIASGFSFLGREAAFEISEKLIPYSPADTYGRAFVVGMLNTIYVAVTGIVLATILGTVIGIARLSSNWLIRKIALFYVEFLRNIPLLLQLFVWWGFFRQLAPGPRDAWHVLPGTFISNRGLVFPVPLEHGVHPFMALALLVGIAASVFVARWAKRRQAATGRQFPTGWASLALIIGLPVIVFLIGGAPIGMDVPELRGFNFRGGQVVSPELTALVVGLVTYTATYIAEIVRSGIQAVSWGQTEASNALGLNAGRTLRLVVLPQALRVIIPPMTSQYLNITKNSSLAIAIGFPDLVAIANTILNQTGQAVEGILLIMSFYLAVSLLIAAFMNWYNRFVALVER